MSRGSLQKPSLVPQVAWDDAGVEARKCLVELARRLGMDSSNSSRPPSSDGPQVQAPSDSGKPAKTKRTSGGQQGHPRHVRTLVPTAQCAQVIPVRPPTCGRCGTSLEGVPDDPAPRRHQVLDLPQIKPVIVEYQQHRLTCPCCQQMTMGKLPAGVPPGQFGPGVVSTVTMLGGLCRLSQRLTVAVLENLFGLKLSTGVITKLRRIGQQSLQPAAEEIARTVRHSPVAHADETSWREAGKKGWLWSGVSKSATLFLIRDSRSSAAARDLLGDNFAGTVITDRYGSYNWIDDARRQFCWAHLLRDFQAMIDIGGEAGEVGRRAKTAGQALIHHWKQLRSGKLPRTRFAAHATTARSEVFDALADGLSCDHAKTEGVCLELIKRFECLWTFTRVDGVEPTNNTAERAVRPGVIWRKISQGTQSASGSRYVETILSVLATCQQNSLNAFDFVHSTIQTHFQNQPPPTLLPKTP